MGADADWRHLARITFFVPDIAFRDACNPVWVQHFPDPTSRPARHTQVVGGSKFASCEFIAYIDDNFGRRWGIRFYGYTMIIGTVIGCVAGLPNVNGYALFVTGRAIIGFGMSCPSLGTAYQRID